MNPPPSAALNRRERRRQENLDDIKAAARGQLAAGGQAGISLRAIARELGMTASAVHYYFPSRQALLDTLTVDGFTSLAEALHTSYQASPSLVPDDRWLTVCRTHRDWALANRSEYLLLYGDTGAPRRTKPQVLQAMSGVMDVLFAMMRDAVGNGDVDSVRLAARLPVPLRRQLASWRRETDSIGDLPEGAVAACMIGYAQLHGAITLELLGHLPPQISDHQALFDLRMSHIATSLHPTVKPEEPQ